MLISDSFLNWKILRVDILTQPNYGVNMTPKNRNIYDYC